MSHRKLRSVVFDSSADFLPFNNCFLVEEVSVVPWIIGAIVVFVVVVVVVDTVRVYVR